MVLDIRLFTPAVGGIHEDDVHLVVLSVIQHILQQRIIMEHLRHIQIMQEHVSDTEHIRELLLFYAVD